MLIAARRRRHRRTLAARHFRFCGASAPLAKAVDRIERRLPLALDTGRWRQRLGDSTVPPVLPVYSTDDPGLQHVARRLGRSTRWKARRPGRALGAIAAQLADADQRREPNPLPRAAPAIPVRLAAPRKKGRSAA